MPSVLYMVSKSGYKVIMKLDLVEPKAEPEERLYKYINLTDYYAHTCTLMSSWLLMKQYEQLWMKICFYL